MRIVHLVLPLFASALCVLQTGAQWVQTGGPEGGALHGVAVVGTKLYTPTGVGLYCSTDSGTTWSATGFRTDVSGIRAYFNAAGDTMLFAKAGGVFRSTDNGKTWLDVSQGLPTPVIDLEIRPQAGLYASPVLYVLTLSDGIYRSTDNGSAWGVVNTGIASSKISHLAVSGSRIWVGTFRDGLFFSDDEGMTWFVAGAGFPTGSSGYRPVEILSVVDTSVYVTSGVRVYSYDKSSFSWKIILQTGYSINALAGRGGHLYVASQGLFHSSDRGINWTGSSIPSECGDISNLALPDSGSILFVGTTWGLALYDTQGSNWILRRNAGLRNTTITSVVLTDSFELAGTEGTGIFRSSDNGDTWISARNGLTSTIVTVMATKPGSNGQTVLFAGTHFGGMFRSTDWGGSWQYASTGLPSGIINAIGVSDSFVFTGSDAALGVFRTSDNGEHWSAADQGMEKTGVNAFAVEGSQVFVGTRTHVYRSTDNGDNWLAADSGMTSRYVYAFAIAGGLLFAGTDGGIFVSTNDGRSWTSRMNGLPQTGIQAFAVSGEDLFVSTWVPGKVFLSTDLGESWRPVYEGLPSSCLISTLAAGRGYLWVGTGGLGVWRRPLSDMITGICGFSSVAGSLQLSQNYPNPFNPSTTIRYGLPHKTAVQLSVYNTLGQQVALLQNGEMEAGYHEVQFDGRSLSSGVYFYRIQAGDYVTTKRLLLLR
jgi:photosystem II stability/assembly factor-like uncharacterized protein